MTSYLTEEEVDALQLSGLDRATPYLIRGVCSTQFSVARYYGGCTFNNATYTYLPEMDELIREDVLAWVTKRRKPRRKPKVRRQAQGSVSYDPRRATRRLPWGGGRSGGYRGQRMV